MPSSHAQFVAFWFASVALFLLVRHAPPATTTRGTRAAIRASAAAQKQHQNRPWSIAERAALSFISAVVAGLVAWSRIYLKYHTPRQVVAGCVVGMVCAVAWFALTAVLRNSGWLAWALDHQFLRFVRARDLLVEEDMCQAGWEKWEDRKAAASEAVGRKKR